MMFVLQIFGWTVLVLVSVLTAVALTVPSARQLLKEDVVTLGQLVNDASLKAWFYRFSWPPRFIKVHFYRPRHSQKGVILALLDKSFSL